MICTNCHRVIKPVVAIDIDGTTGRYHEHFLFFAEAYLGKQGAWDYHGDVPFRDWFKNTYQTTDDVWHDVKLAYRQGGLKRSMPVHAGAASSIQNIKRAGAEIWMTTTRPYIRHDNIDPDTREWLRRAGIEYDYLLYDGDKYQKLADLVGADRVVAVLDDLVEELDVAGTVFEGNVTIWRRNEFNAWAVPLGMHAQAKNMYGAECLILDRIKNWKEQHEHVV